MNFHLSKSLTKCESIAGDTQEEAHPVNLCGYYRKLKVSHGVCGIQHLSYINQIPFSALEPSGTAT